MKKLDEQDLLDLKKEITDKKTKASELKGELKTLTDLLKNSYNSKTKEEAIKKLKELGKQIESFEKRIKKQTAELIEKYNL